VIALLGTGLLGSNFTRAFVTRGETVGVWNRTAAKAAALAEIARIAPDPADAVRGATRIHLSLADDAAVDAVLEAARPGIGAGAIIIDHSTTSVAGTLERAARWHERGIAFLHAPVFMGPQQALDATGVMLVCGDPALIARARDALAAMTGKLVELGPAPERAAAFKLFGNLFLMFLTTGVIEMMSFAKAIGFAPADAATLFESFDPGKTLGARVKRVLAADFDKPSWELGMARKDARLMLEEVARHGASLPMLPAIAAEMDRWIAKGHAHSDWTILVSDALAAR